MNADGWNTLVQAEALAAALDAPGLVVVDCRFSLADPAAGERDYRQAHIPGARYAHLDRDLSGGPGPGRGRHPWPDAAGFTGRLAAWGIRPDSRVVAYDAGDGAFAARLWCLLRMLGHEAVAVLDGGFARWTALGLPVDDARPGPVPAAYVAAFDASRLLDAEATARHLARGGLLVDARAPERFRGEVEPIDPVAGHVPGAVNRPYAANLDSGRFKPPARLREEFEALPGWRGAGALVAMCGSGVTACHHLLALEHAGLHGAALFTGSWSGWISDPARPVATGG
ncbi:sulfurtransferase [Luteimonas wenzhouensis]|mgnify:CR=1 FL=1|jgi:thiosulfate/3-mercaptopyruvate sulfurtransferase|uniref:Sulfurtransferase n=1 Tax=Luteimonas wenzhouensis TaxID=2599615 RepID=A0A5C5U2P1_9GAMM|nr:sulfurtransferase [Luteimonas wenzhouensis]NLW96680.1 sulfurtransferase [Xanthomonadaceae bacterium]TWT20653.1 sulfurtransferase [Luteimonas wenzhouensis]